MKLTWAVLALCALSLTLKLRARSWGAMRSIRLAACSILLLALAGCSVFAPPAPTPTPTPPGRQIPFETLVLDAWAGQDEDAAIIDDDGSHFEPATLLIAAEADLAALARRVSPEMMHMLEQVDYGEECVLALFRGVQGGSGYDTEIQRLSVQGDSLYVSADFWEPGDTASAAQMTSPRHIVKVPCAALPQPLTQIHIELVPEVKLPAPRNAP
jgi:hypothetical protein